MKQPEYGTLEPVALQPKKRSRAFVAVVAAFLVVSAVVAVSFSTGFMQAEQAIDTNRARHVGKLSPTLKKEFNKVCTDKTKRFVIAQFNDEKTMLVPTVIAGADPFDWTNDFKKFKNMLPSFVPVPYRANKAVKPAKGELVMEGEPGVAFAVYDLPVYTDKQKTQYKIIPTFVTYMDPKADQSSKYLGGAFMGTAALAASCTKATVTIDKAAHMDSYSSFCKAVINQVIETEKDEFGKDWKSKGAMAQLFVGPMKRLSINEACSAKLVHAKCPFGGGAGGRAVCNKCKTVNNYAADALWKSGTCCPAIFKHCAAASNEGCNAYQTAIYKRGCDKNYSGEKTPTTKMLSGMKEDELAQCLPLCARTCNFIASEINPLATMQMCNNCRSDMKSKKYDNPGDENDWTGAARCHVDAVGFVEMTCCGIDKECASEKAMKFGRHSCNMAPFTAQGAGKTPCEWSVKSRCGEVKAKQRVARSPKGCCVTTATKDGKKKTVVQKMRQIRCCDGDKVQPKFAGTCAKKTSTFVPTASTSKWECKTLQAAKTKEDAKANKAAADAAKKAADAAKKAKAAAAKKKKQ